LELPPTKLHVDDQGCIKLIKSEQVNAKTKHFDIKLHHVRDMAQKEITVLYVPTNKQLADILTKPLSGQAFRDLMERLMSPISGDAE